MRYRIRLVGVRGPLALLTALVLVAAAACGQSGQSGQSGQPGAGSGSTRPSVVASPTTVVAHPVPADGQPARLRVEVLARYPHDTNAFTEGLVLDDQGRLFESTGRYGQSSVRRVDLATGHVEQKTDLDEKYFGEGIALVDGQLVQLTWKEQAALRYDSETLDPQGTSTYDGEGWGLCFDGTDLATSNGSPDIVFRDPQTLDERRRITVRSNGAPVRNLNELECVGERIYANVFMTDQIVEIDKATGTVTATVDASGLLTEEEAGKADVLNGIAYDPSRQTFLITGKDWPWLYEVRFVPA